MSTFTWRQRLRYRFDNFMARVGSSIVLALILLFVSAWRVIGAVRVAVTWFDPSGAERHV